MESMKRAMAAEREAHELEKGVMQHQKDILMQERKEMHKNLRVVARKNEGKSQVEQQRLREQVQHRDRQLALARHEVSMIQDAHVEALEEHTEAVRSELEAAGEKEAKSVLSKSRWKAAALKAKLKVRRPPRSPFSGEVFSSVC
jgi:hypothetical protein